MSRSGYLLDTNVFNAILVGRLQLPLGVGPLWATHIQRDELCNTRDLDRRRLLLETFDQVAPLPTATTSAVWGLSNWGESSWTGLSGQFQRMAIAVRTADDRARKSKNPDNQTQDALLGQTAVALGLTLVSNDPRLCGVVLAEGGRAISSAEFGAL